MKYLSTFFFILMMGLSFTACHDDDEVGSSEGLSIKVYSPTKVVENQEVVITGAGFDLVESVIFPGGVSTSAIEYVNSNMIKVKTPAGIDANGGELSIKAGDRQVTARIPMTIGNPTAATMSPGDEAGIGTELVITGTDMEFFDQAIFPGEDADVIVNAIDFERKATSILRVKVPKGIKEGLAQVRLKAINGKEVLLPEIQLNARGEGYWDVQETILWEGDLKIQWSDDGKIVIPYEAFANIPAGTVLNLHYDQIDQVWAQAQINYGNFQTINFTEGEVTFNGTLVPTDVYGWEFASRITPIVLTQEILDGIAANHGDFYGTDAGMIIQGSDLIFKKISFTTEVWVEADGETEKDIVLWEGDLKIQWSDDGKIVIPYEMFADMKPGTVINFQYDQIDQVWAQAQINYGNFQTINFTEGEVTFNGTLVPTDVYGWEFDSRITPVVITQEILDNIHANHADFYGTDAGMIIQGSDLIFKKIYYTVTVGGGGGATETVVWEGEEDMNAWGNNWSVKAAWFEGAKVGSEITFYFEIYADFAQFKTETGEWGALVISEWVNQTVTTGDLLAGGVTSLSFKLTEELLNPWFTTGDSWGNGDAMIIHGEGMKFTKITMK